MVCQMKKWNFSAGPSVLPMEVKQRIQVDLEENMSLGTSLMELPHRGGQFQSVLEQAVHDLRALLNLPNDWHILWLQGGARAQNTFIPLNFIGLKSHHCADYIVSGHWSETSFSEAKRLGFDVSAYPALGVHSSHLSTNPDLLACDVRDHVSYVHLCWNETVNGMEYASQPRLSDTSIPLVVDVSSNFLSRPIDFSTPACFYASAQKNAGIAGLTIVLVHESLLGEPLASCPEMFNYSEIARVGKPLNTLPTFPLYVSSLVFQWVLSQGGLSVMEDRAKQKSNRLYQFIDTSDMYVTHVSPTSRSRMNVVFFLKDPALTQTFLEKAAQVGLLYLRGHSAVGGIRVSMYNAMPMEAVDDLIAFMQHFEEGYLCQA